MYTYKFSKKLPVRNQNLHVYCITNKKKKNAFACNLAIFKLRNFKFPAKFIDISELLRNFDRLSNQRKINNIELVDESMSNIVDEAESHGKK